MNDILLTSPSFIKQIAPVGENVNEKSIAFAIRETQDFKLAEIIGSKMLKKLKSLVQSGDINKERYQAYKDLLDAAQYFIAYNCVVELAIPLSFKFDNAGVVTTSDDKVSNVKLNDIFSIKDYYTRKVDSARSNLQTFILNNLGKLPEITQNICNAIHAELRSSATSTVFLGGARGKGTNGTLRNKYSTLQGGGEDDVEATITKVVWYNVKQNDREATSDTYDLVGPIMVYYSDRTFEVVDNNEIDWEYEGNSDNANIKVVGDKIKIETKVAGDYSFVIKAKYKDVVVEDVDGNEAEVKIHYIIISTSNYYLDYTAVHNSYSAVVKNVNDFKFVVRGLYRYDATRFEKLDLDDVGLNISVGKYEGWNSNTMGMVNKNYGDWEITYEDTIAGREYTCKFVGYVDARLSLYEMNIVCESDYYSGLFSYLLNNYTFYLEAWPNKYSEPRFDTRLIEAFDGTYNEICPTIFAKYYKIHQNKPYSSKEIYGPDGHIEDTVTMFPYKNAPEVANISFGDWRPWDYEENVAIFGERTLTPNIISNGYDDYICFVVNNCNWALTRRNYTIQEKNCQLEMQTYYEGEGAQEPIYYYISRNKAADTYQYNDFPSMWIHQNTGFGRFQQFPNDLKLVMTKEDGTHEDRQIWIGVNNGTEILDVDTVIGPKNNYTIDLEGAGELFVDYNNVYWDAIKDKKSLGWQPISWQELPLDWEFYRELKNVDNADVTYFYGNDESWQWKRMETSFVDPSKPLDRYNPNPFRYAGILPQTLIKAIRNTMYPAMQSTYYVDRRGAFAGTMKIPVSTSEGANPYLRGYVRLKWKLDDYVQLGFDPEMNFPAIKPNTRTEIKVRLLYNDFAPDKLRPASDEVMADLWPYLEFSGWVEKGETPGQLFVNQPEGEYQLEMNYTKPTGIQINDYENTGEQYEYTTRLGTYVSDYFWIRESGEEDKGEIDKIALIYKMFNGESNIKVSVQKTLNVSSVDCYTSNLVSEKLPELYLDTIGSFHAHYVESDTWEEFSINDIANLDIADGEYKEFFTITEITKRNKTLKVVKFDKRLLATYIKDNNKDKYGTITLNGNYKDFTIQLVLDWNIYKYYDIYFPNSITNDKKTSSFEIICEQGKDNECYIPLVADTFKGFSTVNKSSVGSYTLEQSNLKYEVSNTNVEVRLHSEKSDNIIITPKDIGEYYEAEIKIIYDEKPILNYIEEIHDVGTIKVKCIAKSSEPTPTSDSIFQIGDILWSDGTIAQPDKWKNNTTPYNKNEGIVSDHWQLIEQGQVSYENFKNGTWAYPVAVCILPDGKYSKNYDLNESDEKGHKHSDGARFMALGALYPEQTHDFRDYECNVINYYSNGGVRYEGAYEQLKWPMTEENVDDKFRVLENVNDRGININTNIISLSFGGDFQQPLNNKEVAELLDTNLNILKKMPIRTVADDKSDRVEITYDWLTDRTYGKPLSDYFADQGDEVCGIAKNLWRPLGDMDNEKLKFTGWYIPTLHENVLMQATASKWVQEVLKTCSRQFYDAQEGVTNFSVMPDLYGNQQNLTRGLITCTTVKFYRNGSWWGWYQDAPEIGPRDFERNGAFDPWKQGLTTRPFLCITPEDLENPQYGFNLVR